MVSVKQILIAMGLAANAALAMQNIGLADCGGLFLLHQDDKQFSIKSCGIKDSSQIRNFKVYGAFTHTAVQGRYTDSWSVKSLSKLNVGSAGFESHYKYITLGVSVNTFPMITSNISVHRKDSLFKANASIARGSINLGNISWIPDKETESVGTISVDWQTNVLYKHLSAESKIGSNFINLSFDQIQTTPHNPEKEHYIRDSANVFILGAKYRHDFSTSRLDAGYTFASADATLYGIFHSENSRKRFLYAPIEAALHLGYLKWDWESWRTRLAYANLSGTLKSNASRYYETLAPNRALPPSAIQGLSFAFLQEMFRVDADLNAYVFLGGFSKHWNFGTRYEFVPDAGLDFYRASGELKIKKDVETTKVMGASYAYSEDFQRNLSSFGSVLSLGFELRKKGSVEVSLDYGISQVIPFDIEHKDLNKESDGLQKSSQSSSKSNSISSLLFRNGFATHLGLNAKF